MKKKNKKIFVFTLATLLILGGTSAVIGVASDGFKNWDTSTWFQDEFKDVKIESKTVTHDGSKKELEIIVPQNASYTFVIKKGEEIVTECIDVGTYDYKVTVTIGNKSKVYKAQLNIVSDISINEISQIKKRKIDESTYEITATILPTNASNKKLEWSMHREEKVPSSNLKEVSDYIDLTINENVALVKQKNIIYETIILEAKTTDGTNLKASCKIDQRDKVTGFRTNVKNREDNFIKAFHYDSLNLDGMLIDLGLLDQEVINYSYEPTTKSISSFFDSDVYFRGGSLPSLEPNEVTFQMIPSDYTTLSGDAIRFVNSYMTFERNSTEIGFTGKVFDEANSDEFNSLDTYLNEFDDHIGIMDYCIRAYVEGTKYEKTFEIFITNTNTKITNLELNEESIIF